MAKDNTIEQTKKFYVGLRAVPLDSWMKMGAEEISRKPEFKKLLVTTGSKGDLTAMATGVRFLGRVAHSCSEKEFHEALANGEFPPLKMSQAEMALVSGGFGWRDLCPDYIEGKIDEFCEDMRKMISNTQK